MSDVMIDYEVRVKFPNSKDLSALLEIEEPRAMAISSFPQFGRLEPKGLGITDVLANGEE